MRRKSFIILAILILVILLIIIFSGGTGSTLSSKQSDFAIKDTSTITRIFLADKQNNVVDLQRTETGRWMMNGEYPAMKEAVKQVLKTIQKLEVRYPVPKVSQNSVITRMASLAVKVELYQNKHRINLFNKWKFFPRQKLVKTFYVGDNTQDNLGTFMLMEGSDKPYVVYIPGFRGFVSTRFSARIKDWRDHTIFSSKIYEIAEISVEFPKLPEESYRLKNIDDRNFSLESMNGPSPMNVDTMKVLNFLTSFDNIKFEALLNEQVDEEFLDSVRNVVPEQIITLTTKTGTVSSVSTYLRRLKEPLYDLDNNPVFFDRDRKFAFVNEGRDFVLVQYFVFNRISKPLSWFSPAGNMVLQGNSKE